MLISPPLTEDLRLSSKQASHEVMTDAEWAETRHVLVSPHTRRVLVSETPKLATFC